MEMNGVNKHLGGYVISQPSHGKGRMDSTTFARNNLAKGGVNKDLGGSAKSGVKQPLRAGKANMNTK